jgi:hypothetical protein
MKPNFELKRLPKGDRRMFRFLSIVCALLFGLLVLTDASGVADADACHEGDHIQALSQTSPGCRTEPSHTTAPCGMLKPCTPLSCMGMFIADGPHDPDMLSE